MTAPVRVLQIANQAGPLNLFILPVCRALRDVGAEVELACMTGGPLYEGLVQSGFPLHGLEPGGWADPRVWWRTYRRVRRLMRDGRFDLMVAHTPIMSWIARYAARGLVPATIYMSHGLPFAPGQGWFKFHSLRWVERRLARYTDALIVMNQADYAAGRSGRLTRAVGRCFLSPGVGVDLAQWEQPPSPESIDQLNRQLNLAPDKPLVCYLGRFIRAKRPGDVLELARRVGPRAQFLLAGEGPLWPRIRRQAQAIGPHVKVLEFTHQVHELIHRSAVVVLPSVFREGLPRVLLEAQAAGRCVVAYDVRGSHDAIDPGRSGYLVAPRDVEAFIARVRALLDDPALRQRMGQAGRAWIARRFALPKAVRAQLRAIRATLAAAGGPNLRAPRP